MEVEVDEIEINTEVSSVVFADRVVEVGFIKELILVEVVEESSQEEEG